MNSLSVVIPAYNEEQGISEIMQRVLGVRSELADIGIQKLELLIVDDGSKDQTAAIARKFSETDPLVRVITHQKNKGYGGALKTGFSLATGDLIGFMDADGTYPPEYYPALCKSIQDGAELVIGSRMAGSDSQMPLTRRIGNFIFANLLSVLGWQKISDSASGMRVFRREILARIYPLPDGLNLTPIMSTRAVYEEIKMVEVPIPYSERVGRSKLSVVRDGWTFLESMVWTVMSYNPTRVLGIAGMLALIASFGIFVGLVIARLSGITEIGPWGVFALFSAMVLMLGGFSIFALGVTFNYLVSIFYKKKIRQGLFGKPIFNTPLENHFGWFGLVAIGIGTAIGLASLVLGLQGWEIARLWLYLLGSAMVSLVGIQLVCYWALMRVLDDISKRAANVNLDMSPQV